MVFLHRRASKPSSVFQTTGRAVGAGLCCGAVELLQLEVDLQDIPKDQTLKRRVVGVDHARVVFDLGRERLAGQPCADLAVIKGVGHTQHFGACILRVVVHAATLEVTTAAGFKINV